MKTKKQLTNRILSLVLTLVMVTSMLPLSSLTASAIDAPPIADVVSGDGSGRGVFSSIISAVEDAIANPGSTLVLRGDITTDDVVKIESGNFTIDLNGKTWKSSSWVMYIGGNTDIKIIDSSAEGTGKLLGTSSCHTISLCDNAKLEIAGGTVENTGSVTAVDMTDGGNLTNAQLIVSGGRLTTNGPTAINAYGSSVTVTGGTLESTYETIFFATGMINLSGHKNPAGITIWSLMAVDASAFGTTILLPEGYILQDESGDPAESLEMYGIYTVSKAPDPAAVASVTTADGAATTYYTDFATAVNNWTDGTTLTLLTNVEYGERISLDSSAERTFVGGEYTLTLTDEYSTLNNYGTLNISSGTILANCIIAIRNYGTLNINSGTVSAPQENAYAIANNGSMILHAGSINGYGGIENYGTAELKGGTVTASELYALFNFGTAYLDGANLTTQGENVALQCETGSETTISGGTLSSEAKNLICLVYSKLIITDTANCDGWTVGNVGTAVIGTDIILPNENYYMVVEERGSVTVMEYGPGTITYDAGAPTGKITVTEQNFWEKLINKITFGLFFKDDAVATVTSSDADSGVKSVEYYVAFEDLIGDASLDNAAAVSKLEAAIGDNWKTYDKEIALSKNANNVIYVKITDNVGNVTYISSDGIVLDSLAPELFGIEDGGVYYGDKVFKAMDENFLKIEVDGSDITDTTEGDDEFKILADNAEHTVTVTDKAGNVTEYTITVYKRYSVTFTNSEGGSYEKEFKYGEVITIPTNEFFEDTFRKTGYTLTGWQGYTEGMTMPLENLTFTAVYTPNNYTVEFDANGGEAIAPITVTFGEKYGRLPSSSVAGLSGGDKNWYLVDANGNVTETNIKNLTLVSTARDHKLFIKRNVLSPNVSITLAVPGGISDGYQYYIPGASQRVLTATVNNANTELLNYTYQWYKDGTPIEGATASVLTLDGNVADSGTYKVEVTATLKDGAGIVATTSLATGSKEQNVKILHAANTLSYDANGGEGGPQSSYTGGTSLNVSKDEPTREHYDFIGWNTKADGSGDSYKTKDAYTFTSDGGNGGCTVTLYAQWKAKEYTVTYMADGQTVSTEKVEYSKGATLPTVPEKDGYVGKWDSDGKNITEDTTISAVYTEIPVVKPDEVKPEDKTDLEDAKAKLEEELADDSYTDDDKKDIQDAIDDIDDALEVIGNVDEVEKLIDKLPDTIKKDDETAIKAADDAYNALTDYEKSLVDEDAKKALNDAKAALAELKKSADSDSPATGDNSNMFLWFALLFISGGVVITLAVVDRKRRTAKR